MTKTRPTDPPRRDERDAPDRPAGRVPDSLWVRMVERWRAADDGPSDARQR
jgi:hypothetical protein